MALALATLVPAAHAGTPDNPEVKDAQYDMAIPPGAPTCAAAPPTGCVYLPVDIWMAWITESADNLSVHIGTAQAPPSTFGAVAYTATFTVAGATVAGTATVDQAAPAGDGAVSASGAAKSAAVEDQGVVLVFPKDAVDATAKATAIVGLTASSSSTLASSPGPGPSDTTPAGRTYNTTMGPGGAPQGGTTTSTSGSRTSSSKAPGSGPSSSPPAATAAGNVTSSDSTTMAPTEQAKSSPAGWLALPVTLAAVASARRRSA